MSVLRNTLDILYLIVLLSQNANSLFYADQHQEEYLLCSTDGACPTWFVCNLENNCQCGATHDNAVVCDD